MQVDDNRVRPAASGLDRADQRGLLVGAREPRLIRGRGPARHQVAVDHLGRGDDRDPLTVENRLVRRERLTRVLADEMIGNCAALEIANDWCSPS